MSLLSAVLQEADKATAEDLKKQCDHLLPSIKDLTDRIQLLSFALQQNFIDLYVNFSPSKSLEQLNYNNRKSNIMSDYSNLMKEIECLRQKYKVREDEFSKSCEKLEQSLEFLKKISIVAEAKNVLDKANHEYARYNYNDAILSIKTLQEQFKRLKFDDKLAEGLYNISNQAENQISLYMAHLSTEWEEIFNWTEKKSVFYLTYSLLVQQSDTILIQKVLKTLYSTERLNAELGLFSHFFVDKLLHNVIRHNCDIYTEDHIGALVFNIKIDLNDPKKPNYQMIFNNLTAIFEFLDSTLGSQFECDRKFIEVFADTIREKFFNKIINDCIKNNLPSCESSYQSYLNIVSELDAFNKFLIDIKFVDGNKSPLNKYINDTECVLYNKKCDKLLSDVRNLLSNSISFGTQIVGKSATEQNESILDVTEKEPVWDLNTPLFLPKCVISQNVKKIMTLIVEHLDESVKLPEKYSKQLVMYIKDIAVMYQCIVPKKFKINLESCPLDIALFFNNCFYLAHGLVGPPWKNSLPAELADTLVTVLLECIQDLRVLGLGKMSLYLQKQKDIIMQTVEARDVTETLSWTSDNYEKFDSAVNDTIILLNDHKTSWYNVLPLKMYEMSMCTLIQTLCQSILLRVFADSCPISEDLVYMLALRLQNTIKDMTSLFEDPIQLEAKINVWTKFTTLPQLLKAQLLEMADLWKSNKDLSQSYTCEEIRQLVKMRFPDDSYRLKILKEIQ